MRQVKLDYSGKIVGYAQSALLFERHDLNAVVAVQIKPHRKITRLMEIEERGTFGRTDIAMINVWQCPDSKGEILTQLLVFPNENGRPTGNGWVYLTPTEKESCITENRLMLESARANATYAKALGWFQSERGQ